MLIKIGESDYVEHTSVVNVEVDSRQQAEGGSEYTYLIVVTYVVGKSYHYVRLAYDDYHKRDKGLMEIIDLVNNEHLKDREALGVRVEEGFTLVGVNKTESEKNKL